MGESLIRINPPVTTTSIGAVAKGDLVLNVKDYGAKGDGTTDDTTAFQAAITAAHSANAPVFVPSPSVAYKITATLSTFAGMHMFGAYGERQSTSGGSEIRCQISGGGDLFRMGTNPGAPYDANNYNGPQGLLLEDLYLRGFSGGGTLTNGQAAGYASGACAIRDYAGGSVRLNRVGIESFEEGFWGIQSDINHFVDVTFLYCKRAMYLGPRSDQFIGDGLYAFFCDKVLTIDCARGARFNGVQFVANGSATVNPITVTNTSSSGTTVDGIVFNQPWFEHYQGSANIDAFIEVGVGDTTTVSNVGILDPVVFTNNQSTTPHAAFFLKTDNADLLYVRANGKGNLANLSKFVRNIGTSAPSIVVDTRQTTLSLFRAQNDSTGIADPLQMNSFAGILRLIRDTSTSVFRAQRSVDSNPRLDMSVDGNMLWGSGAASGDVGLSRKAAHVLGFINSTDVFRANAVATGSLPSASTAGAGAFIFDSTVGKAKWSDGTNWSTSTGNLQSQSANYTALASDATVLATAGASGITVTLPAVVVGQRLEVKKVDSGAGVVTVTPASGTIDGAASVAISGQYQSLTVVSDGTNWFIV